jgi:hypothetical protein
MCRKPLSRNIKEISEVTIKMDRREILLYIFLYLMVVCPLVYYIASHLKNPLEMILYSDS